MYNARQSRRKYAQTDYAVESVPEVECVYDTPEVYKLHMVRMSLRLTKSRMYGSKKRRSINASFRLRKYVRISKNFYYESPCNVIGITKHTGSEGHLRADMNR